MRFATRFPGRFLKRVLPRSLLGRSLLIILLPLVLVQVVALQIFYGNHLELISRRFAGAVAGEIGFTLDLLRRTPDPAERQWILDEARAEFEFAMRIHPGARLTTNKSRNIPGPMDDDLAEALREKIGLPFRMDWTSDPQSVLVEVQFWDGVLEVEAPRKRLYTSTIYLFVLWLVGSAILLFSIAALFMRNQVRAIRRLARERPRQARALLLPARERAGRAGIKAAHHRQNREHLRDARICLGARNPRRPEGQGKILGNRQAGKDAAPLRHIGDPGARHRGGIGSKCRAVEPHGAREGRMKPEQHAQQGRFPRAIMADQAEAFARGEGQIDAIEHRPPAIARGNPLGLQNKTHARSPK
jgi:hypothetical protein